MIDIEKLFKKMSNHIAFCKSAPFVCTTYAAFESWFRVELVPVFWEFGYPPKSIETNYTYPSSKDKADLCIRKGGNTVFELKSFVNSQDANKKRKYPGQIKKLETLIVNPDVLQVITFTTFIGYSIVRMKNYMDLFFTKSWDVIGPDKLINKYPLYVALTSMTK